MLTLSRSKSGIRLALLMLALLVCADTAFADPPSRVARLSELRGDVSFSPAGEDNWYAANLNRPLVGGDRLYTDRDARTELDVGEATVRLDEHSSFSILELDDRTVQLELTQGTLNLHVHNLYDDQSYEVDTPTLAFVISQPGEYRIDIDERGNATSVTVFDGAGDVFGEGGARYRIDQRLSYRFNDSRLRDVSVQDLPRPDDFDNWCFARDEHYDNSLSRRYVSDGVIGAADLDDYGDWDDMPDYGSIWFPARVGYGWAPYRDGHWAWIDPWGWTWVDNAPWGFAPFHYGRWVYVGNRWGWLPGPAALRPVYAPALVVFVGGNHWRAGYTQGGAPVGWCPLGPRDVYVPPYRVSRGYFTHVNTSNTPVIDHDHIGSSYENYAHGRPDRDRDYTYRHNPNAVTAVTRDTFVHARPVAGGRLHLDDAQLVHDEIVPDIAPSPTAASLAPTVVDTRATVPRETFRRGVIARNAPPPAAAPFAVRLRAIERNGGRPLAGDELQQLKAGRSTESHNAVRQHVQVIGPAHTPSPLPPDSHAPQFQESNPRVGRIPFEERSLPLTSDAPAREFERNTGQGTLEQRGASGRPPASRPDTVRTEERRPSPAKDFARERNREIPAPVERRNAATTRPVVNTDRALERHPRRESRESAPGEVPQARRIAPAPRVERRPSENPAPPERHPTPRSQPSLSPEQARGAEHVRVERHENAKRNAEVEAQEPGTRGR